MNLELITAVIFYAVLGFIIYKNRKKIEIMDKVFFVYKWKKGVDYIKKLARPEWFWKIISTISIPVCLFFALLSVNILIDGAKTIISAPEPSPTVSLLIPGVKIPGSEIYVPFWYGIISIIVLVVVHEASHGIIALVEKIRLKTTGIGLLLFLPLAFVEPEEQSFLKAQRLSRIRMLSAGSFANLVTALLAFLLVVNVFNPVIESQIEYTNVVISSTLEGEPAFEAGIPNNSRILMINNESIDNITAFQIELIQMTPNQNISITTSNGTFYLTTAQHPSNPETAYLGVIVEQEWEYKEEFKNYPQLLLDIPLLITQLLMWISNLNFAVGVFNLLPLWITDGGKIIIDLLSTVINDKKTLLLVINTLFFSILGLLLFNMIGPFLINALQSLLL